MPTNAPLHRVVARFATVALAAGALVAIGAATASADPTGGGPKTTHGPCRYTETPDEPAARPVPLPRDPRHTPDHGVVEVELRTNLGEIPLLLDRAQAPCTVQSFLHLTRFGFYNRTICHRLTAYPTLKVLQCGDPTGTGEGGPGYEFKDELPTNLKPWPDDPTGQRKIYPRATVAMANAGPNTNGSQFFLVYADSRLLANDSIFGRVSRGGLRTLDRIAAGGVAPTPDDPTLVDGPPALRTEILRAHIER